MTEDVRRQVEELDNRVRALVSMRGNPLLVLYYPDLYGNMSQQDLRDCYDELRGSGHSRERTINALDVLLHTYGGDPVAAYRLAQMIRDFAEKVVFLVPEHAYSGGTLLCFCGDQILLGDFAGLSPIDITLAVSPSAGEEEEVELTNIDYYMDFAKRARGLIETVLKEEGSKGNTNIDSDLLVEMVKQAGALRVAKFYRERTLTGYYAQMLLDEYMFRSAPNREQLRNGVIMSFLFQAPAHEFHMDYHISKSFKLAIEEMSVSESDAAKAVINGLTNLTRQEIICRDISDQQKMPFIRFYPAEGGNQDEGQQINS